MNGALKSRDCSVLCNLALPHLKALVQQIQKSEPSDPSKYVRCDISCLINEHTKLCLIDLTLGCTMLKSSGRD